MSLCFDTESLMFQTDWSGIEEWFERPATEAGHNKYNHSELIDISFSLDPSVEKAAKDLSYNLGRSISELFLEASAK
jgi:hypothetical protein